MDDEVRRGGSAVPIRRCRPQDAAGGIPIALFFTRRDQRRPQRETLSKTHRRGAAAVAPRQIHQIQKQIPGILKIPGICFCSLEPTTRARGLLFFL